MTRNQVFAAYKVRDGFICSPGKFEGEPVWAPHMYEAYLAGDGIDPERTRTDGLQIGSDTS